MAGKARFTDEEKDDFIEMAQLHGIAPAIKKLGYPSYTAAVKWFDERGIERPTLDSLMAKAAHLKVFYGDSEKKYAIQTLMEAIIEKCQENDLDADGLNKLANALAKMIQTYQLIEGKATGISESRSKDGIDLGAIDVLNAAKAKNALKEAELG